MMETETSVLPHFVSATRQKADLFFEDFPIFEKPLGAGAIVVLPLRRVSGYGRVGVFAASPQPFTILLEEACSAEGTFSQAALLVSAPDAVSGLQFVSALVFPSGNFMRVTITNAGAAALLDQCIHGLPHGSGGP